MNIFYLFGTQKIKKNKNKKKFYLFDKKKKKKKKTVQGNFSRIIIYSIKKNLARISLYYV